MAGCGPGLPGSQPRLNSQPAGHCASVEGTTDTATEEGQREVPALKGDGEDEGREQPQQEKIVQPEIFNYGKKINKKKMHKFCILNETEGGVTWLKQVVV